MKNNILTPPTLVMTAPTATAQPAEAVTDTESRAHHPYSPSGLCMLEACACFKPRISTNARAIAGTLAHKVVETLEDDARMSDDDAEAAAECLDFVESRRRILQDEADKEWTKRAGDCGLAPFKVTELKEIYLPVDDCKFEDCESTTAGYVDHVLLNWNVTYADVIDYKFGMWAVEVASENTQGFGYVLGLFKMYPTLQKVHFWFKQPHIDYMTDAVFTRDMIPMMYLRIQAIVERARVARRAGDFKLATPMVPACNFCDNLGDCPVGLKFALKVGQKFSPLDFPSDITPSKVLDPLNTKLALNLAAVMKVWSEAFRRQVTDRVIRRDAPVPDGMKIQQMPGRRQITDMKKFKEIALRYMTEREYSDCLDASFGTIEEVISTNAPRGNKKAMVEAFQHELEQFGAVTRGDGFSFLKAANDK